MRYAKLCGERRIDSAEAGPSLGCSQACVSAFRQPVSRGSEGRSKEDAATRTGVPSTAGLLRKSYEHVRVAAGFDFPSDGWDVALIVHHPGSAPSCELIAACARPSLRTVGRHEKASPCVPSDAALSLRHALCVVSGTPDSPAVTRVVDLSSSGGVLTEGESGLVPEGMELYQPNEGYSLADASQPGRSLGFWVVERGEVADARAPSRTLLERAARMGRTLLFDWARDGPTLGELDPASAARA